MTAPAPADFPHLHDLQAFYHRFAAAVKRIQALRPFACEVLGHVGGHPIYLLAPADPDPAKPNILSAGGFHGEEPAGPWGILEYLETASAEELTRVNHAFLPLVNPTGFARGQRLNMFGENPNRGFVPENAALEEGCTGNNQGPSAEGEIFMRHLPRLLQLARDGFVTQHEDDGLNHAFLFVNEKDNTDFTPTLLGVLQRHFDLLPDGGADTLITDAVQGGVWRGDLGGAFEDLLFLKGIPRVATTETPGLQPAAARVACNRTLTRAFAAVSARRGKTPPAAGTHVPNTPKPPGI